MGRVLIRTQFIAPLVLSVMVIVSAVVAALLDRPVWAAVVGTILCLGYWALEAATMHIGSKVPAAAALGVALGGMVLRLALVLGALVMVAMLWRPEFATTVLAFVASFTIYLGVRMITFPLARGPMGTVRAQ
ncbi:MAG TPA: hypothetical protein VFH61_15510 [Thermoleophilia bacterium]|nr:hypothetical protein [Thermoleophilia bacterium]